MVPQRSFVEVIQILTTSKIDVLFVVLNLICECVSAALEQVAGKRLYLWVAFVCALVAFGFASGEFLWMKKKKIHIGLLDVMGFTAAVLQVFSCCTQIVFAYLHAPYPIKFSLFSMMFASFSTCHKILWKSRTQKFMLYCKESSHFLPLKVSKEKHSRKTLFECPICDTSLHRSEKVEDYVRIPVESLKFAPLEVIEWIFYRVPDPDGGVGGVHDDPRGSPRQSHPASSSSDSDQEVACPMQCHPDSSTDSDDLEGQINCCAVRLPSSEDLEDKSAYSLYWKSTIDNADKSIIDKKEL